MRKYAIAITTFALATSLTACSGAGNDAPTRMINQVTDGVDANIKDQNTLIYLRNIHVLVNESGEATLIGTIINQKDTNDALIALAINKQEIKIAPIPALLNKPITFGGDIANAAATLPASGLTAGAHTTVSFFFGLGGSVSVDSLVVKA